VSPAPLLVGAALCNPVLVAVCGMAQLLMRRFVTRNKTALGIAACAAHTLYVMLLQPTVMAATTILSDPNKAFQGWEKAVAVASLFTTHGACAIVFYGIWRKFRPVWLPETAVEPTMVARWMAKRGVWQPDPDSLTEQRSAEKQASAYAAHGFGHFHKMFAERWEWFGVDLGVALITGHLLGAQPTTLSGCKALAACSFALALVYAVAAVFLQRRESQLDGALAGVISVLLLVSCGGAMVSVFSGGLTHTAALLLATSVVLQNACGLLGEVVAMAMRGLRVAEKQVAAASGGSDSATSTLDSDSYPDGDIDMPLLVAVPPAGGEARPPEDLCDQGAE
jgi:hypothetical protein